MEPPVPRLFIIVLTNVSGCHQWICCGGFAFLCFIILIWLVELSDFISRHVTASHVTLTCPPLLTCDSYGNSWSATIWQPLALREKWELPDLGVSGCWRCMVVAGRTIGSHSQYYSIVSRFLPTCILQQAGKYMTICDLTSPEKPLCCHCYVKQCKFGVIAVTSNHRRRKLS